MNWDILTINQIKNFVIFGVFRPEKLLGIFLNLHGPFSQPVVWPEPPRVWQLPAGARWRLCTATRPAAWPLTSPLAAERAAASVSVTAAAHPENVETNICRAGSPLSITSWRFTTDSAETGPGLVLVLVLVVTGGEESEQRLCLKTNSALMFSARWSRRRLVAVWTECYGESRGFIRTRLCSLWCCSNVTLQQHRNHASRETLQPSCAETRDSLQQNKMLLEI